MSTTEKVFWIPLESNPEAMNQFLYRLGVLPDWEYWECFGLDPETLAFVPQPCIAVIVSFPYDKMKIEKKKEREKIEKEGQEVSPNVYFMKQTIENACGAIAVIHSIANNTNHLHFSNESVVKRFIESTKTKTPHERGEALYQDKEIAQINIQIAHLGDGEAPPEDADVESHFVCFCEVDGSLYELDGAKHFPINHGKVSHNGFLLDAAQVIKRNFVDKLSNEIRFTMIALCPSQ